MKPNFIFGGCHKDDRGCVKFNNDFNMSFIKRMYTIENNSSNSIRGWQGHKIEQRWFIASMGSFQIDVKSILAFENEDSFQEILSFKLLSTSLDVLHIPPGYVTCIHSLEKNAQLLAFSDFELGDVKDEWRFIL
jgi:dTDP-4-dehydrorhamnose 3,5-epimerase-like enzyme